MWQKMRSFTKKNDKFYNVSIIYIFFIYDAL